MTALLLAALLAASPTKAPRAEPGPPIVLRIEGRDAYFDLGRAAGATPGAKVLLYRVVTALHPRACRRRVGRDLRGGDLARRHLPQHPVFHLRPGEALLDVQRSQAQQRSDNDAGRHRREGSHPRVALAWAVHRYRLYPRQLANGIPAISSRSSAQRL